MEQTAVAAEGWYRALTLPERLALLRQDGPPGSRGTVDAERAARRIGRWKSEPPFSVPGMFQRRLAAEGIDEAELARLLGESTEAAAERLPSPPIWLTQLLEALSSPSSSDVADLPDSFKSPAALWVLAAVEPLVRRAIDRVREGVRDLVAGDAGAPIDAETVPALLAAPLPDQLLTMLHRTLILELNVARVTGLLQGETKAERFQHFVERLRHPEQRRAFLSEYPVLARQIMNSLNQWSAFSLEFLQHLTADWPEICAAFGLDSDAGVVVAIKGGAGDRHRDGRSVLIVEFSSGFQLVYKPRSVAVDLHFQDLLGWLNSRGDHPPFRTLTVLDRGDHGWVEFVRAESCAAEADAHRFYERQGGYLALLYALEATDFHYENLIAAGEHPVLIDMEALFHPRVGQVDLQGADDLAIGAINYSVLAVGLLPQQLYGNAETEGVDLSGLGTTDGQLTPFAVPGWEGAGTDEMRVIRKQTTFGGTTHRPTVAATEVDVLDYAEDIVDGFTRIYRLLWHHHDDLLADDGPIAKFADDEVRVLVRSTRSYVRLLHESYHPNVLRDALDRDRLFDRLWAAVEHAPVMSKIVGAEQQALRNGDIPLLTTRPRSRDVWTGSEDPVDGCLDESGLTLVRRRMGRLSETDLAQQLWFVRASLATLATGHGRPDRRPQDFATLMPAPATWAALTTGAPQDDLGAAARAIGDRLDALALRGEYDVSWVGLTPAAGRRFSLEPLGPDLYDGLPGVALFLAYLGSMTGEERYSDLARAATQTLHHQVERGHSLLQSVGGFRGWGGILYAFTHLASLWDDPALWEAAASVVALLPPLIADDEHLDIVSGVAGCILPLIGLYQYAPSARTLAAARHCGEHLLSRVTAQDGSEGWPATLGGATALTGFSHGAAGMALSLLQLAGLTGDERFRRAALAGMEYERTLFSAEARNWPDLRSQSRRDRSGGEGPVFQTAWCHGAPGIGLARLASLPLVDDQQIRSEIVAALETTLAHGMGGNQSLCHGDLGNVESLLQASRSLPEARWQRELDARIAALLDHSRRHGWWCANPLGVESPGLMTGLAGIGFGLLRLAAPSRVPSVLVLEPPKQPETATGRVAPGLRARVS